MERQNQDPSKRTAQHVLASEFVELVHGPHEARDVAQQHRDLFSSRNKRDGPTPIPTNSDGAPEEYRSPFKKFLNKAAGNPYAPQSNYANMSSPHIMLPESLVYNQPFNRILWYSGLVSSRSEGYRLIVNKGAHVAGRSEGLHPDHRAEMPDDVQFSPIRQWTADHTQSFIMDGNLLVLRVGKWKIKIIKIVSDKQFQHLGLTCPGWNPKTGAPASLDEQQETPAPVPKRKPRSDKDVEDILEQRRAAAAAGDDH